MKLLKSYIQVLVLVVDMEALCTQVEERLGVMQVL
jgi:hypothetical protein